MVETQGVPVAPVPPHLQEETKSAPRRGRFVAALVAIGQFLWATLTLPLWIWMFGCVSRLAMSRRLSWLRTLENSR